MANRYPVSAVVICYVPTIRTSNIVACRMFVCTSLIRRSSTRYTNHLEMKNRNPSIVAFILGMASFCQAQLIHPNDMTAGRWSVSIKRRDRSLFESMVFPRNSDAGPKEENQDEDLAFSKVKGNRKSGGCMNCDLILDSNGTFTLLPPDMPAASDAILEGEGSGRSYPCIHQPLKGLWHVRPNPYCVTDRHYDELRLKSIPKVRIPANDVGTTESSIEALETWEQVTVELNCNVWGRFGSNPIRHMLRRPRGKDAGRLTHGTISIVKTTAEGGGDHTGEETRRVLCATFQAGH